MTFKPICQNIVGDEELTTKPDLSDTTMHKHLQKLAKAEEVQNKTASQEHALTLLSIPPHHLVSSLLFLHSHYLTLYIVIFKFVIGLKCKF